MFTGMILILNNLPLTIIKPVVDEEEIYMMILNNLPLTIIKLVVEKNQIKNDHNYTKTKKSNIKNI
tara:strand:- start:819 stop:1016 length:198 start_codon:yes stop_codon:yes gene_type:complete